jgi:hypothetical protein
VAQASAIGAALGATDGFHLLRYEVRYREKNTSPLVEVHH